MFLRYISLSSFFDISTKIRHSVNTMYILERSFVSVCLNIQIIREIFRCLDIFIEGTFFCRKMIKTIYEEEGLIRSGLDLCALNNFRVNLYIFFQFCKLRADYGIVISRIKLNNQFNNDANKLLKILQRIYCEKYYPSQNLNLDSFRNECLYQFTRKLLGRKNRIRLIFIYLCYSQIGLISFITKKTEQN